MDDPTKMHVEKRRSPSLFGFGVILFGVVMLFVFPPLFLRREIGRSCPMNGNGELYDCTYEYAEPILPLGVRWALGAAVLLLVLAWIVRGIRRRRRAIEEVAVTP